MQVGFEAVCGPKFTTFWDDAGDPCCCQRTWPIVYIVFHLPLGCEVIQKVWFLGTRFVGGGVSQISDMRFQTTLIFDHMADFRW